MSCSNASQPTRRQVHGNDLPTEILSLILHHCRVSDINTKISFKLSCRKFYHTVGSLRMLHRVIQTDANLLFERICMDDDSESQRTGRRVCSICKQRHPADYFVDEELEKRFNNRVCKNSQRRLRLTPKDSFSYATLLSFKNETSYSKAKLALGSPYNEGFEFRPRFDRHMSCNVSMEWTLKFDSGCSEQSLRSQLTQFPVYVCPHSRSDSDAFAEAVVRFQDNRARNPSYTKCTVCGIEVHFTFQTVEYDKKEGGDEGAVTFHACRTLGRVEESAMGAEWIGQTEAPDFDAVSSLG